MSINMSQRNWAAGFSGSYLLLVEILMIQALCFGWQGKVVGVSDGATQSL